MSAMSTVVKLHGLPEVWKTIADLDGYEVSDLGRVRSVDRLVEYTTGTPRYVRGRVLRQQVGRGERSVYARITIGASGYLVHRLVLEAFVGPRPDGQVSRHLNGDELDNRATNLAWGTQAENIADQVRHGTHVWARATRCVALHPLVPGNLALAVTGDKRRVCLACKRAQGTQSYSRRVGRRLEDLQRLSDAKYSAIVGHEHHGGTGVVAMTIGSAA